MGYSESRDLGVGMVKVGYSKSQDFGVVLCID